MAGLYIDGLEVSTSQLSWKNYKAASCELVLVVTAKNLKHAIDAYRAEGFAGRFSGLRVVDVKDLGFLSEFPDLLYLEIENEKAVQADYLEPLENLRGLRLTAPSSPIDFGCFPQLEQFIGPWHAGSARLDQCRELRRVRLTRFNPKSADFSFFTGCVRVEELSIVRSSTTTLDGVEALEDLTVLELAYASKLVNIEAIEKLDPQLRELELNNAKKIASYSPFGGLRHLRRLKLSACAPIPDLTWAAGMSNLDHISFVQTNLVDGNLEPLLALPRLDYVGIESKRHYSHSFEDINELLSNRSA